MAAEAVFTRHGRTIAQGMLAAPVTLAGEAHGEERRFSAPGDDASGRRFGRCGSRCLSSGPPRIAHGNQPHRTAALPASGPCDTSRTLAWSSTHSRARGVVPLLDLGPIRSTEAEVAQDEQYDHHHADDVEDVAHGCVLLEYWCKGWCNRTASAVPIGSAYETGDCADPYRPPETTTGSLRPGACDTSRR